MRSNHVPRAERLQQRINRLELKRESSRDTMNSITGSEGNPYWGCTDCQRADPQLTSMGHGTWCSFKGLKKEIAHYRELLHLHQVALAREAELAKVAKALKEAMPAQGKVSICVKPSPDGGAVGLLSDRSQGIHLIHDYNSTYVRKTREDK